MGTARGQCRKFGNVTSELLNSAIPQLTLEDSQTPILLSIVRNVTSLMPF